MSLRAVRSYVLFGVRRQSEAATALWIWRPPSDPSVDIAAVRRVNELSSAPAERSGDGALDLEPPPIQSGVALRLPPHSKELSKGGEQQVISVRAESSDDIAAVRRVNELAFDQPNEAALVDALRKAADPYISLVATDGSLVVGHIFFSPVSIESQNTVTTGRDLHAGNPRGAQTMGLAPLAVLPEHQNRGVGSLLVREGLGECKRIGCDLVVVVGHPKYYPRFGFIPANQKGLQCEYSVPPEAFMVTELKPGTLTGKQGLVKYRPEFASV